MRAGNCWHVPCAGRNGDHLESNFVAKGFGVFMDPRLSMSQHQRQQRILLAALRSDAGGMGEVTFPGLSTGGAAPKALLQLQALQYQGEKGTGRGDTEGFVHTKRHKLKHRTAPLSIRKHFSQ